MKSRTPKHYDGTKPTSRQIKDLLPRLLGEIGKSYKDRGDLILAAWPEIIGPQFAEQTRAISFEEGVLTVAVKSSTLYSLLVRSDRLPLLQSLQKKFPTTTIKTIHFRKGV